jgi:hypothetical protein
MAEPTGHDPLSEEISSLFNRASFRLKDHQFACLERFELSPIQANALWRMDPRGSLSVGALAERFRSDPSNLSAPLEDLEKHASEAAIKAAGRLRSEGKSYIVQDGDIVHFRFNV